MEPAVRFYHCLHHRDKYYEWFLSSSRLFPHLTLCLIYRNTLLCVGSVRCATPSTTKETQDEIFLLHAPQKLGHIIPGWPIRGPGDKVKGHLESFSLMAFHNSNGSQWLQWCSALAVSLEVVSAGLWIDFSHSSHWWCLILQPPWWVFKKLSSN